MNGCCVRQPRRSPPWCSNNYNSLQPVLSFLFNSEVLYDPVRGRSWTVAGWDHTDEALLDAHLLRQALARCFSLFVFVVVLNKSIIYVCTHIYIYIYMYTHMCIYIYIHILYIYIYIYIYTHIHIYTYGCIYVRCMLLFKVTVVLFKISVFRYRFLFCSWRPIFFVRPWRDVRPISILRLWNSEGLTQT